MGIDRFLLLVVGVATSSSGNLQATRQLAGNSGGTASDAPHSPQSWQEALQRLVQVA